MEMLPNKDLLIDVRNPWARVAAERAAGRPAPLFYQTNLMSLDGVSAQEYASMFKGNIKNAIDSVRFSRLRIAGGVAVSTTPLNFFSGKPGIAGATAAGTAITLLKDDTNMRQPNEMEFGNYFIVESVQILCIATAQTATTDVNNEITVPDAAAIISSSVSASINMYKAMLQAWFEFKVGDNVKCEGLPIDFPPSCGLTGFGGGLDEGLVQNGFGFGKALRNIVILRPTEQFLATLEFPTAWTPSQDLDLYVRLMGTRLKPVS